MSTTKIILEILFATIVSNAIGMFWYSPKGFGTTWLRLKGVTPEMLEESKANGGQKGMSKVYALNFLFSILTSLGLLVFFITATNFVVLILQMVAQTSMIPQDVWYIQNLDIVMAFVSAFVAWLTFSLPQHTAAIFWDNKPWKYFLINAGYTLVSYLSITMIYALVSRMIL